MAGGFWAQPVPVVLDFERRKSERVTLRVPIPATMVLVSTGRVRDVRDVLRRGCSPLQLQAAWGKRGPHHLTPPTITAYIGQFGPEAWQGLVRTLHFGGLARTRVDVEASLSRALMV
jgi:hypothetical protein